MKAPEEGKEGTANSRYMVVAFYRPNGQVVLFGGECVGALQGMLIGPLDWVHDSASWAICAV
ncbi:hypothetical protein DGo_PC0153 (plasmid) [Deinococcus gobiensis I-0]|uniref:Uncharacterized protein n=1 Tax=Deinococcus gobiensis (strain DSM 21396 / JCM 16679 / CGMCC 1.7299 / I-0) TaxID=745776 RepID=H8H348_DEIGI|nr:hypothetical protein DGo_PC0153 [Deinococcus gobiensis I-0]